MPSSRTGDAKTGNSFPIATGRGKSLLGGHLRAQARQSLGGEPHRCQKFSPNSPCQINCGDHPEIVKASVIFYRKSREFGAAMVDAQIADGKALRKLADGRSVRRWRTAARRFCTASSPGSESPMISPFVCSTIDLCESSCGPNRGHRLPLLRSERRRGPGRGGARHWRDGSNLRAPLSPTLSPFVPHGEREPDALFVPAVPARTFVTSNIHGDFDFPRNMAELRTPLLRLAFCRATPSIRAQRLTFSIA